MILFLNFAPISFMGGAEKWMNETSKKINSFEESRQVSVAGYIASIYSSIVLKRKFDNRSKDKDIHNHYSLNLQSFLPFTSQWFQARSLFTNSRLIYARYELPEFMILLYFSGIAGLKKTVAGIHSPFAYRDPETFFEKLHNQVYQSPLSKKILSLVNKVHVLNKRDLNLFTKDYSLKNVEYVPNGMPNQKSSTVIKQDEQLHILYVGELSRRKGVDRLIEVVLNSPSNFIFTIAGDGTFKDEIKDLAKTYKNCFYKGYVKPASMPDLYKSNEVLFLPSRAESMPLSILEALSYGLLIVDSPETNLDMDKSVELTPRKNYVAEYVNIFSKIFKKKQDKNVIPKETKQYFVENFSDKLVEPMLYKKVFNISL